MEPIDCAYIAGFFDGEGNVSAKVWKRKDGSSGYSILLQTAQKDRTILGALCDLTGLGSLNQMRKPPHELWSWRIGKNEDVLSFVEMVEPFSIVKRGALALAKEMLELPVRHPRRSEIRTLLLVRKRDVTAPV